MTRPHHRWGLISVVLAILVPLGACDAQDSVDPPSTSSPVPTTTPLPPVPQAWAERLKSQAQWKQDYASCMTDLGFPATVQADGGVAVQGAGLPEQHEAYLAAEAQCDPQPSKEELASATPYVMTDAEIEYLYALTVRAYECLVDQGFTPAEPESLESYRAQVMNRSASQWDPFYRGPGRGSFPTGACKNPLLMTYDDLQELEGH